MFTGIITDIGDVRDSTQTTEGMRLVFSRPEGWDDLRLGDSIATNGACLTVEKLSDDSYSCLLVPETLDKTTFKQQPANQVNLERSLRANARLDGSFVLGHVDSVGKVTELSQAENGGRELSVRFASEFKRFVINKGSITIDGVALTVTKINQTEANDAVLSVGLIPFTLSHTTLGTLKSGDLVNLEFDVLGKYVVNSLDIGR